MNGEGNEEHAKGLFVKKKARESLRKISCVITAIRMGTTSGSGKHKGRNEDDDIASVGKGDGDLLSITVP